MSVLTDAEIAEFRALAEDLGMPDTYDLISRTQVSDGKGGTTPSETTVESGACSLTAGALNPVERLIADRANYQTPIIVELPMATVATPRHRLVVNGTRALSIAGVLKDGRWGITARAICQESA